MNFADKVINKVVLILAAAPGRGKSFFADFIKSLYSDAVICCADDEFYDASGEYKFDPKKLSYAHSECQKKFAAAMEDGKEVIVIANTNVELKFRKKYIDKARKAGYNVISLAIENQGFTNQHGVPDEKVEQMVATLSQNFRF